MTHLQQMIVTANQRLYVLARHAVNNRRLVAVQFTAVTRSRAAACNICRQNQLLVLFSNIESLEFVLHPYVIHSQ